MAEKMSVKDQAIVRSHLYEVALNAIVQDGKETEVIADGALIHLGDGQFAKQPSSTSMLLALITWRSWLSRRSWPGSVLTPRPKRNARPLSVKLLRLQRKLLRQSKIVCFRLFETTASRK